MIVTNRLAITMVEADHQTAEEGAPASAELCEDGDSPSWGLARQPGWRLAGCMAEGWDRIKYMSKLYVTCLRNKHHR